MANVFQIIATDKYHPSFETDIVNVDYHAEISTAGPRTVCGIQLDGEDGVAAGPTKAGPVTCPLCHSIIKEIKAMRKWE
jgi:hypothetical protein